MVRRATSRGCAALTVILLFALMHAGPAGARPRAQGGSQANSSYKAPLIGLNKASAIDGRYIVVFNEQAPAAAASTARVDVRALGARILHSYSHALDGFAAQLSQSAVDALRSNPHVAFIEADSRVHASDTQSPATWGLDRIDQRNRPLSNSYTYNATGSGVNAYIIDTGIRFSHTQFGGRAVSGFDSVDGGSADDCNGHGTHVAGTVGGSTHGVAKGVRLIGVRVLNCQGSGSNSGVIAGVDWGHRQPHRRAAGDRQHELGRRRE